MIRAYFDGSESTAGPSICVVAGYAWRFDEWKKLQRRWRGLLAQYGLEFFRMADFESFNGPYKDWSNEKHKQALNDFLGAITQTALYGCGVAVMVAHHKALDQVHKERIPSPYRIAAAMCWGGIGNWIRDHHPQEYADYIFELGDTDQGPMRDQVKTLMESQTWRDLGRIRGVHFEDKRCAPALQPADILAYETLRDAQRFLGYIPEGRKPDPRYPLQVLLESVPHDSALLDSTVLYSLAAGILSPSDEVIAVKQTIQSELRRRGT